MNYLQTLLLIAVQNWAVGCASVVSTAVLVFILRVNWTVVHRLATKTLLYFILITHFRFENDTLPILRYFTRSSVAYRLYDFTQTPSKRNKNRIVWSPDEEIHTKLASHAQFLCSFKSYRSSIIRSQLTWDAPPIKHVNLVSAPLCERDLFSLIKKKRSKRPVSYEVIVTSKQTISISD